MISPAHVHCGSLILLTGFTHWMPPFPIGVSWVKNTGATIQRNWGTPVVIKGPLCAAVKSKSLLSVLSAGSNLPNVSCSCSWCCRSNNGVHTRMDTCVRTKCETGDELEVGVSCTVLRRSLLTCRAGVALDASRVASLWRL